MANKRVNRASSRGNKGGGGIRRPNKQNSNSSSKYIIIGLGVVVLAIVAYFLTRPSSDTPVTGYSDVVVKVIDGRTLQLRNGLKVELLGIESNPAAEAILRDSVMNKRVTLQADSKDAVQSFKSAENATVRAYVTVEGLNTYHDLNAGLLKNQKSNLNPAYVTDNLTAYTEMVKPTPPGPDSIITDPKEIIKQMTKSTFLIVGFKKEDGKLSTVTGTGFFINDAGLALTNAHVIGKPGYSYAVFLPDENGKLPEIKEDNGRNVSRSLYTGGKKIKNRVVVDDYCIFTVDMDNTEKMSYLNLSKVRPEIGERVQVCGNPGGVINGTYTLHCTDGQVSGFSDDIDRINITANTTYGNSGGPVCDSKGRVIGIATNIDFNQQGQHEFNLALDIQKVRETLDSLKSQIAQNYGGK